MFWLDDEKKTAIKRFCVSDGFEIQFTRIAFGLFLKRFPSKIELYFLKIIKIHAHFHAIRRGFVHGLK